MKIDKFKRNNKFKYKKNDEIFSSELFVINEQGEQLGVITKVDAMKLALEVDLDLVEVSPHAKPPVAKIMSWSKFKYQQDKKKKEAKTKRTDQKEMWFKSFIAEGDLKHKLKKVEEFLLKKHPVKITIRGKGRSSFTQMNTLMKSVLTKLQDLIEIDSRPKFQGRNLTLIVRPIPNINKNSKNEKQKENT